MQISLALLMWLVIFILAQALTGEQIVSIVGTVAPILVSGVTVIGVIWAGYFAMRSAKIASEAKAAADKSAAVVVETGKKADTIIEKAVEIHTLTNSNLAKVTAANEKLQAEVAGMRELIATLVKDKESKEGIARKLAEKVAPGAPPAPATAAPPAASPAAPQDQLHLVIKPKTEVVIEGTLETKESPKDGQR